MDAYDQKEFAFAQKQMEQARQGLFGALSDEVYRKNAAIVGRMSVNESAGTSIGMPELIGSGNNLNDVYGIGKPAASLTDTQMANVSLLEAVGNSVFRGIAGRSQVRQEVPLSGSPSHTGTMGARSDVPMSEFFPAAVDDLFMSDMPEDSGLAGAIPVDYKKGLLYGGIFILALAALKAIGGKK